MWVGTGTWLQARKFIASKFESVREKIATWQKAIDKDPITLEGIKSDYDELKGIIHSFYQEAIYARVTDKLSYDIISLIALIDHVKRAANRYIRNENRMANTIVLNVKPSNKTATNDISERVSELGVIPSDNNSPIVASGRSGFETLTDLVNPNGFGNLTAMLQVQGGGGTSFTNNNIAS